MEKYIVNRQLPPCAWLELTYQEDGLHGARVLKEARLMCGRTSGFFARRQNEVLAVWTGRDRNTAPDKIEASAKRYAAGIIADRFRQELVKRDGHIYSFRLNEDTYLRCRMDTAGRDIVWTNMTGAAGWTPLPAGPEFPKMLSYYIFGDLDK